MQTIPFQTFGPMFDCSRNAVLTLDAVKQLADICADFGYKSFLLYTEDTYEVLDNPYFGYGRGRYSCEELREIDRYTKEKGLEFIPCIQTLGHLTCIFKWAVYKKLQDCHNILMPGEEGTYQLIEDIFRTLSQCITTRTVNIGLDEAHMVGRGRYYDLHGDVDHTKLLVQHVARVAEIASKYGFRVCMWSDMFFRIASGGDYYNSNITVSEELKRMIPDNVDLIYWDYYSDEVSHYTAMMKAHDKIKPGSWFAGVLGSCRGFSPCNGVSIKNTKAAIESCLQENVSNVFLTSWGDDGGECSRFAFLPSLLFAAETAKGNGDIEAIQKKFEEYFGIPWEGFMLLDLLNGDARTNASKYLLYNDPFFGLLDTRISEDRGAQYGALVEKLEAYRTHPRFGYLFDTARELCHVLEIKANLGQKTRAVYQSHDKEALSQLVPIYQELSVRLKRFYKVFRTQWFQENKPFGFDVQDIRLGGLMTRVEHCTEMLTQYLNGEIEKIDELEERLLDYNGEGEKRVIDDNMAIDYKYMVTPNVLVEPNAVFSCL